MERNQVQSRSAWHAEAEVDKQRHGKEEQVKHGRMPCLPPALPVPASTHACGAYLCLAKSQVYAVCGKQKAAGRGHQTKMLRILIAVVLI